MVPEIFVYYNFAKLIRSFVEVNKYDSKGLKTTVLFYLGSEVITRLCSYNPVHYEFL